MTKEEFFAELSQIPGWELDGKAIRKFHRDERGNICHCNCPITAVANKRIGHHEWTPEFHCAAADYLGLGDPHHGEVLDAADFRVITFRGERRGPPQYRKDLLAACHLEEE